MPDKLPDSGWPERKKFKYAVERLKAESRRDEETTVDYWLAGLMINEIRKDRKTNGEWVEYLTASPGPAPTMPRRSPRPSSARRNWTG